MFSPVVTPDGAGSPAASQSILAALSKSVGILPSGESADGAGSNIDTRDNQLDELNSRILSGRSIAAAPNSPDSLSGAVVQTPSSVSCVDGAVPNSNSALNNVNSKETSDIDNEDINDNDHETSSEGLLSDDESCDNESDNEEESSTYINNGSENVVPSHNVLSDNESSTNMEIETENEVPSTHPPSSGTIVSPGSKLPVAVGKGCGSSVSAKIPRAPGLVYIRPVAPTPRVLAPVCVKLLRTGVCCLNSANEDGAVHNYHRR